MATSTFTFGRKSTTYSAPLYNSVCPFCRPNPFTSVTVIPCTPIDESASRTSSSLKGLMIAVTSFIGVPWLERLADREHDRALAGVLRLTAAGIKEAVRLDGCAATAFRVGVYVRESEHPAAEVLGDAELPVVVARVAEVLDIEMPEVADQTPAAAEIPGSAEVDVARILGIGEGEGVVDRPKILSHKH